jgi:RNA polymerase sigma-70 factor (ECF subfamily)
MNATSETWHGRAPAGWVVRVSAGEPAAAPAGLEALAEPALVRACVEGQPGAFDVLVARNSRAVYQLCYRFLGNHEDATDAAQDVFLRAFRALPRFKGESSISTWLYRIAVNHCLNRRSLKTAPSERLDDNDVRAVHPPEAMTRLLAEERAARVRAAVARLPERQRAALILRIYHELPHQEIAAIVGTSEGAVKANFFHALRNLRKWLSGEDR